MAFVEAGGIQTTKASGGQAGYGVSTLRGGALLALFNGACGFRLEVLPAADASAAGSVDAEVASSVARIQQL